MRLSIFERQPKSIKRTVRYILQDVHSIEKLEEIQSIINIFINRRKKQLIKPNNSKR